MSKTILTIFAAIFLLGEQTAFAKEAVPPISAKAAIIYHADYGNVLWEKESDRRMLIASTTKIMTAIVAIEQCGLNDPVEISSEMTAVEGSSMYLRVGEVYTVRELLYGLLLASGNDAATAIAVHAAGSQDAFVGLMNDKAKALGLQNTHFDNPHGLDSEAHYSTASDLARLMGYAMENSTFAEICGTRYTTIHDLTYVNHNKMLWQCDGVIGGKTGYTQAAGRTLVTCCERNGQRLICVTLSDTNDWADHGNLYDWAFRNWKNTVLMDCNRTYSVALVSAEKSYVQAEPLSDVSVFSCETDETEMIVELPRFDYTPIHAGDKAGRILVLLNQKQVREIPLVYMEHSNLENKYGSRMGLSGLWDRLVAGKGG